ncbi:uncharacterized protein LOC129829993 isoform X1 [Salvelinus fontinalis]|uniref:uncharacterized protein LOC129829993 isoform X1 n=1 Tax=Salvelinus fontinalis TaxID=8038 RepID=UPI002485239D|nr:uncharacterized protein LOC129829993 isoform X1 [Salvelinus fontinalis]XP_055748067.1 uncharacterized protein LOC129829993 isoform X1 [Salvelinus fontinalis]
MSDKGTISAKEGAEKRGRGRPRKQPPVKSGSDEPSGSPTPKRPRGRPKGSKNKTVTKGKKTPAASTAGMKRRGRPKKELTCGTRPHAILRTGKDEGEQTLGETWGSGEKYERRLASAKILALYLCQDKELEQEGWRLGNSSYARVMLEAMMQLVASCTPEM